MPGPPLHSLIRTSAISSIGRSAPFRSTGMGTDRFPFIRKGVWIIGAGAGKLLASSFSEAVSAAQA